MEINATPSRDVNSAPPQPKASRRYILFLTIYVFLYVFVDGYLTAVPIHINNNLQVEFGLTVSQYYTILSIASIGLIAVLAFQYLSDIIGRKPSIILSFLGMSLSGAFMGFAADSTQFTIAFFLSFVFVSTDMWVIFVSEEIPGEKRGRIIFWITIFTVMATFIGPIARAIWLKDPVDPVSAATWRVLPMLFLVGIPLALLGFGIKESSGYSLHQRHLTLKQRLHQMRKAWNGDLKKKMLTFVFAGLYLGLGFSSISTFDRYLYTYFLDSKVVTTVFIIMSFFAMITFFVIGPISDKIGRKKLSYIIGSILLSSIVLLVIFVEQGIASSIVNFPLISILSGLTFASYFSFLSLNRVHCIEIFPTEIRGSALGWRSFAYAIGVIGGSALSALLTLVISVGWVFIIYSGLIPFVLLSIYKVLPETKKISIF